MIESIKFPIVQYFSLPSTLIYYITNNLLSGEGLLKLQKTCKYFVFKTKTIVIDKMVLHEKHRIFFENEKTQEENYWLTGHLKMFNYFTLEFSRVFYRCNLKKLTIFSGTSVNFSLEEFDFLLNAGKVESLWLTNVNIHDENENLVSIDKILSKVPNLLHFGYSCNDEIFTNETFRNMKSLEFNFKFKYFQIIFYHLFSDNFYLLCNFIEKNVAAENSQFVFEFSCNHQEILRKALVYSAKTFSWKDMTFFEVYQNSVKFKNE